MAELKTCSNSNTNGHINIHKTHFSTLNGTNPLSYHNNIINSNASNNPNANTSATNITKSQTSSSSTTSTIPTKAKYLPEDPLTTNTTGSRKFRLSREFVDSFKDKPAPFGYNGLGELVYRRTYSRKKPDGNNESWYETVERVVNGTYNMQKRWIEEHGLGWNSTKAQASAKEMYRRIFDMKFLPPGRGLWSMGSPITEQRNLFAALNNCFTMDQQLLTSDGFMFYDDIVKKLQRGEVIKPACFIEKDQSIEYHPITLADIIVKTGTHNIVDIKQTDTIHSNHIDISVTEDHDLYGRLGAVRHYKDAPWVKIKAAHLFLTKNQKKTKTLNMKTAAINGRCVTNEDKTKLLNAFTTLGLTTIDQQNAFFELYGYWLGDGSLHRKRRALSITPTKPADVVYLDKIFSRLPLEKIESGQSYGNGAQALQKGYVKYDMIKSEQQFYIFEEAWFDYFDAEYQRKYKLQPSKILSNTIEDDDDEDDETIKCAKWLFDWILTCVDSNQAKLIMRGLRFADGNEVSEQSEVSGTVFTSSTEFRDEIMHLAFNAGYSVTFKLLYAKGKQNGYNKKGLPIIAKHDHWAVYYSSFKTVVGANFEVKRDVSKRTIQGKVWCVQVPTQDHLIVVRKASKNSSGVIEKASRPVIIGNCAFVSTENINHEPTKPFTFLMDASMLGVGVGFDTKGAGKITIKGPDLSKPGREYIIPDSREGWVDSLRILLDSYFYNEPLPAFDYSLIRPFGTPIKGFGGLASGPQALQELLSDVKSTLDKRIGQHITVTDIVDIMNYIGRCVVAGNVRRCLPENSLVHTKNGLIPIQNIKLGDLVLTVDGYKPAVNWFNQGIREMVKIVTQNGEFICTPNHRMPVLTSNNNTYNWIEADKLQLNDRLITCSLSIEGTQTYLPNNTNNNTIPITIPQLDEEMAWLIGLFHTNGSIHNNTCINFNLNLSDEAVASKAIKQMQRFVNNLSINIQRNQAEDSLTLECESSTLASYFKQFLTFDNILPEFILKAKSNIKLAYLAAIADCSDNNQVNDYINLSFNQKQFAQQIQILLYSCGIESRLNSQAHKHHIQLTTQKAIQLFSTIPQLTKSIVTKTNVNSDVSDNNQKFNSTKVMGIEHLSEPMHTYDIQVLTNHNFYCNGYLTHNTAEIAFGEPDSKEYLDLKNYNVNPHRSAFGWTSNNSIYATIGMDYSNACDRIRLNGEPGFAWLENMRNYSRMNGIIDKRDIRAAGGNPCVTGDTMVLTTDGLLRVDQLIGTKFTAIVNGKRYSSSDKGFWHTGVKLVKEIELENGLTIKATDNHKFLLDNNTWVELGDLNKDSILQLSNNKGYKWATNGQYEEGIGFTENYLWGDKFEPRIPLSAPYDFTLGLLRGFFQNFGEVDTDNLTLVIKETLGLDYLKVIQQLLWAVGIPAKLISKQLIIPSHIIQDFVQLVKLDKRRINEALQEILPRIQKANSKPENDFVSRVKSIHTVNYLHVYDCTINDIHCFSGNGIIAHNCLEQTLESFELCCLVETFPARHKSKEDFLETLKYAYLYAKTVTLGKTQWPETNRVMLRNRRIGTSVSGIAQFLTKYSIETLRDWLDSGYDEIQKYDQQYSDWFAIPRSIKTTSVKPSGTVSLLAGATPGMHYPESRFYIRRIRLASNSELMKPLQEAGYSIEPVSDGDASTSVVEIPIDTGSGIRVSSQVSMWEQLNLAAFLQKYWADNQVSCTVTFDPKTEGSQLETALNYFQYQLKGISFLPKVNKGAYKQMPYEEITEQEYSKRIANLKPLVFHTAKTSAADSTPDRFCDGDSCATVPPIQNSGGEKLAEPSAEMAQQSVTAPKANNNGDHDEHKPQNPSN